MAVSYIGYVGVSDNATNHNADLTIPVGANFALIGIAYWNNPDPVISAISLDGQAATLVARSTWNSSELTLLVYRVSGFGVGAKNFTCTWNAVNEGVRYMLMFFSNVNLSSPIHDYDNTQHTTSSDQTLTTGAMDSSVNDMVVAFACGYGRSSCTMTGGSQTEVDSGVYNVADYGAGYKQGTGATDTATAILSGGALIGVTLAPSTGGTPGSDGPNYPGTVSEASVLPYDDEAWTNVGNVGAEDSNWAEITANTYDTNDWSYVIRATNFGLSIPAGATIDGILVEIFGYQAVGNNAPLYVQLTKDGTTGVGDNLGVGAATWATSPGEKRDFGGAAAKWGTTWSDTDFNSSFGVLFANQATGNNADIYINYIRVTVYYTEAAGPTYQPRASFALCDMAVY